MAKRGKLLPARRQRDRPQDGDSILLRSAESIGRVIGTLQRQLDGARSRLSGIGGNGNSTTHVRHNGDAGADEQPKATPRVRSGAKAKGTRKVGKKKAEAKTPPRKSTKRTRKGASSSTR